MAGAAVGLAASREAAGEARGKPGSAAQQHLGAWCYLQHWDGDSGRGSYVNIRDPRRAPCGAWHTAPVDLASSRKAAGEACGKPGAARA